MQIRSSGVSEKTLDVLIDLLSDGTADDARREEAALAIKALGDDALPPLRKLLQADDADLRWWSARALAALGGPSSVSLLIETLSDPDSDVRACAALGLGALAAAEAAAPLTHLLADESAYVGRIAGNALIQIGQSAVSALIEALNSQAPAARAGAARALIPLESHAAIPALFTALDDESVMVTHYAQDALWRMGVGMVLIKP
jgi:HEAT repeat protein